MKAIYSDNGLDISDEGEQSKFSIIKLDLENIYQSLSDEEKRVFDLLKDGYSQKEISKICRINQSNISRLKDKIKKRILNA
jgi:RNA polymerase sigma factor (sigma-70 family)